MKNLLFILTTLIVFSCSSDDCISEEYIMTESEKTHLRFKNWAGTDEVIIFPIITDLHSGGNNKYTHINFLSETYDLFKYDFVVNNGDIGLDMIGTNTTETAQDLINKIAATHDKFTCPVLMVKGNHDMNAGNKNYLTETEFSNYLQKSSQKKYPQIKLIPNKAYGYMDIETKKARIIFLDSNDNNGVLGGYSYHTTQLQWLKNVLTTTPQNFTVIVLSHRFPDEKGDWYVNYQPVSHNNRVKNEITLKTILSTFISRTSGVSYDNDNINLSWDFSNSSGKVAGILCGDSHFDVETKVDGINIICTQGYGNISENETPPHAIITHFDYNYQILIDIVAVKPKERKMKYFRLGAGGENKDREFTF